MKPVECRDYISEFVMQLLRTGLMLQGLLSDLLEDLPEDAFPDEENAAVLVEMLIGTITPVAEATGEPVVNEATTLLEACSDKTLADLRGAMALRTAMDRGPRCG